MGVDLSPVNPLYEIPENCDFIVADVNDGLTWPDGSIDLVHSRYVCISPELLSCVIFEADGVLKGYYGRVETGGVGGVYG